MKFFKPFKDDDRLVILARVYMLASSLVVFGLGAALVSFGTSQTWPSGSFLFNPYLSMVVIGSISIPGSMLAFAGAATAHRLILFIYMISAILMTVLLMYAGVLCFLCSQTSIVLARDLNRFLGGSVKLTTAGGICIASSVLLLLSYASASITARWSWTKPKMAGVLNFVTLVLAAMFLYITIFTDESASSTNSRFALAVSVFALANAIFGGFALVTRWQRTLKAHATISYLVAMLCVIASSACIAAGNVRAAVGETQSSLFGSNRLLFVGSYSLISCLAIFAEVGFIAEEILYPKVAEEPQELQHIP